MFRWIPMVLHGYLKTGKSSYATQPWDPDLQGPVSLQPHRGQIFTDLNTSFPGVAYFLHIECAS